MSYFPTKTVELRWAKKNHAMSFSREVLSCEYKQRCLGSLPFLMWTQDFAAKIKSNDKSGSRHDGRSLHERCFPFTIATIGLGSNISFFSKDIIIQRWSKLFSENNSYSVDGEEPQRSRLRPHRALWTGANLRKPGNTVGWRISCYPITAEGRSLSTRSGGLVRRHFFHWSCGSCLRVRQFLRRRMVAASWGSPPMSSQSYRSVERWRNSGWQRKI